MSLRQFDEADAPALVDAVAQPEVARLPGTAPFSDEREARAWIERAAADWRGNGPWRFAVADARSGELLGYIGVRLVDSNGQIGYWVRRAARGRGVATSALRMLSRWALTSAGFERLQLVTETHNVASQRVAVKAGFQREGLLRSFVKVDGDRVDGVMFGLLRDDVTP